MSLFVRATLLLLLAVQPPPAESPSPGTVRHGMTVILEPGSGHLEVIDEITLPAAMAGRAGPLRFLLHEGMNPSSPTPGVTIARDESAETPQDSAAPVEAFRVDRPAGMATFELRYAGMIRHPLTEEGGDYARGFRETPGTVSEQGVFLSGASRWYPDIDDRLVTFDLEVSVPAGWDAVSQGTRSSHRVGQGGTKVRWACPDPQVEIFLVAARFTEVSRDAGSVRAMTFLRSRDDALAAKYLDVTGPYLRMYERMIGPYPYTKFALVENFWETGYGMPSFTLLGPRVIRLPFILHSSYPHEILHNWWGNGVYVDERKGNWSEGLTAYLADHLIEEQKGRGAAYRQTTLQKYADYVSDTKDFPLADFLSRRDPASEAVGYGKALMFFHGLRRELGDEGFVSGLREFYRRNRFRRASFDDLRICFEETSGRPLEALFSQATMRAGAPRLRISLAGLVTDGQEWILKAYLRQVQPGAPYQLRVPLIFTLEGRDSAWETTVTMTDRQVELSIRLPARPRRLDVDPSFDLFRLLDPHELPPALSGVFGARRGLVVLPSAAPPEMLEAFREVALEWSRKAPETIDVSLDSEIERLPSDRSVWVLGWQNRFLPAVTSALERRDVSIDVDAVGLPDRRVPRRDHSVVLTARHPDDPALALAWVGSDRSDALPGLARKLPHYHKYSYLAFEGGEPTNVLKGRWAVIESPLSLAVAGPDGRIEPAEMADLADRAPLAVLPPSFSKERMMDTVRTLASEEMGGRGLGTAGADRSAEFIASRFREAGLQPLGEQGFIRSWTVSGGPDGKDAVVRNVVGIIPGTRKEWDGQSVVVGAHYDHLGHGWPDVRTGNEGRLHPGADDNGSGVSILLELAGLFGRGRPERTIVFAAFSGEEAERLGSRRYVTAESRFPVSDCIGMINLDTVGRLGDGKLLVLGTGSAREWVHIFNGAGYVTGVPVQPVADDFGSSDQKSFLDAGVPAVQLFGGAHPDIHSPADTPDRIDADGLVRVASVAREAIDYLASRPERLTSSLSVTSRPAEATGPAGAKAAGRKVSLGTVPDFTHPGPGVRLAGVVPGSPAEGAGLREGDILVGIDDSDVADLRGFSEILKSLRPGRTIRITYEREGERRTAEARVVAR